MTNFHLHISSSVQSRLRVHVIVGIPAVTGLDRPTVEFGQAWIRAQDCSVDSGTPDSDGGTLVAGRLINSENAAP